jgi:hypothetical protein
LWWNHNKDSCTNEPNCAKCGGTHPASHRESNFIKNAKAIQEVKQQAKTALNEARKMVISNQSQTLPPLQNLSLPAHFPNPSPPLHDLTTYTDNIISSASLDNANQDGSI